jgi:integrase
MAGRQLRDKLERGARQHTLADAYQAYLAATTMKDRSRDHCEHQWTRIEPVLGHQLIEEIDTWTLDGFKQQLPSHLGPASVNHHLGLIRAVLSFMWKRGRLPNVPYIPKERVPKKLQEWYAQAQRDQFLDGMFRMFPIWYLFFYITCRLGLRCGETYAITHRQVRHIPPTLVIDQQVQRGYKQRPAKIITRKNDEAYSLELTQDVLDAIEWHIEQGFAGDDFLFSKTGEFPRYIDSHVRPMQTVQRKLGLPLLGHHAIGRHSVASQAATGGESIKAIQAQLGHRSEQSTHRYAHLGSRAQLRVVEALEPSAPPHASRNH